MEWDDKKIAEHNAKIPNLIKQFESIRWEDTKQGMPWYKRLWNIVLNQLKLHKGCNK